MRPTCRVPAVLVGGVLAGVLLAVSACSSSADQTPAPDAVPAPVRSLVEQISGSAGSVSEQQAVLAAAVDPADGLDGCAPATTTIRLEPVWDAVRPTPGWAPSTGRPPAGEVFAVPAVVRIVRDGVVTGTDLATLHVGVADGTARLAPFCLR